MRWGFSTLLLLLSVLSSTVQAREQVLFTSSITYCAPPEVLIVQEFDIQYFNSNTSIAFALSATNFDPHLNATANIVLNTYGLTPFNISQSLCDILQGQLDLCPLPEANVTGRAYIPIPSLVQIPIPGIAFSIPDLEAVAQLTLTRVETGEVAVCLQSTLSNGRSLHTVSVEWATFIISILSFFASFIHSFFQPASSPIVFRTVTVWSFFQHIALSGTLHLNYPLAYTAFATNFAWSLGLFSNAPALQSAIIRMRTLTGSSISSDTVEQPGAYTDRSLSPYNLKKHYSNPLTSRQESSLLSLVPRNADGPKSIDLGSIVGGTGNITRPAEPEHNYVSPALITSTSQTLASGIPTFVNYVGISTGSAWMSTFFGILFLWLGYGGMVAITWLIALILIRFERTKNFGEKMKKEMPRVAAEGAIRLLQISFLPVLVFALFQWTLRDNWLSTFISVIAFLAVLGSFGWLIAQVVNLEFNSSKISPVLSRLIRPKNNGLEDRITQEGHESTNEKPNNERSTEPKSSSPKKWWSSIALSQPIKTAAVSAFVAPYRPTRQTFSLLSPFLLTTLKAFFIALAKTHGFTQVLALIIIEFLYLIAIIIAKPFYPRYRDGPKTTLDSPGTGHSPIIPSPAMDSPECKSPDSKNSMGRTNSPQEKDIEDSNPHPKRRKANIFSRRGDFLELFLSVLRIISTAGLLPFVREKLAVDAIPRVAVGIGIAVVCSVGVLVLVANIVVHILPWKSFWRGSREEKDRSTGQEVHQTTSPTNESL